MNWLIRFPNQFSRLREILKKFSKPSSESQESKKTNQVENQLRMTENRHKQRQKPKLLFQQTEFSEPVDLVSQLVQKKPSSERKESKKTNQVENQLRMTENRHKRRQRPKLLFQQTEFSEPTRAGNSGGLIGPGRAHTGLRV